MLLPSGNPFKRHEEVRPIDKMGYTLRFSEQNRVDCFSQRGEVLYAAQRARKRDLTPSRHAHGVQVPPQTVLFFFERGDMGQQDVQIGSSTDHPILSTNPRGRPPFLPKIYIPPHFVHRYTLFCLKPYPPFCSMANPLRRNGRRTTQQPACRPTSIWCCGSTQRQLSGAADPHKIPIYGTLCAADTTQMILALARLGTTPRLLTPRSRVPCRTKKWEVMPL